MDQKANAEHRHEAAPAQLVQLDRIIDEMRLIKSPQEIELMQIASKISAKAHTRAMQTVRPWHDGICTRSRTQLYIWAKRLCAFI